MAEGFHPDPLFTALFLIAIIYRQGKYFGVTESSLLQFKLWICREFWSLHDDTYLGQLQLETVTSFSYPFQTPRRPQDQFDSLEKKGWHVIDVSGDGNCGYYSFFLGLKNIGRDEYFVDTGALAPRTGWARWKEQVMALRRRLLTGSKKLLKDVFPVGCKNRDLLWWMVEIGAVTDEDKEELSDSFLIPNNKNIAKYFNASFINDPAMHTYHMHPYWGPLVFAYVFRVRVVVITRKTVPIEKKKDGTEKSTKENNSDGGNINESKDNNVEATNTNDASTRGKSAHAKTIGKNTADDDDPNATAIHQTTTGQGTTTEEETIPENPTVTYAHSTKIFDFVDGFERNIDTYVAVTSFEKLYRLSDHACYSKPTIEILYVTGFKEKNVPDDQHFLFLRRVLCKKVPYNLPISEITLRNFIITPQQQSPLNSSDRDASSTIVNPESPPEPSIIQTGNIAMQPTETTAPSTERNPNRPTGAATTTEMSVDNVPPIQQTVNDQNLATSTEDSTLQPEDTVNTEMSVNDAQPTQYTVNDQILPTSTEVVTMQPEDEVNIQEETATMTDRPVDSETIVEKINPKTSKSRSMTNPQERRVAKKKTPAKTKRKKKGTKNKQAMDSKKAKVSVSLPSGTDPVDEEDTENQSIVANAEPPANVLYDATTERFFTARFDNSLKRYLDRTVIEDTSTIDRDLINDAKKTPNSWVSLPLGDASDDFPPAYLTTKIKCVYEQLNLPYCVTYCMANALYYCGFDTEARDLATQASLLAPLPMNQQLQSIRSFLPNLVPSIGSPTVFGWK